MLEATPASRVDTLEPSKLVGLDSKALAGKDCAS